MVLLLFCDNAVSIASSGAVVTCIGIDTVSMYIIGCSCCDYLVALFVHEVVSNDKEEVVMGNPPKIIHDVRVK